jgi:uncharacterized damage-inducible protein DinB
VTLASGREAVLAYYDRLHEESSRIFARFHEDEYDRRVTAPGGGTISLGKWLRAMAEHEIHHRGQLYLMLGMLDVRTPPVLGMTAEQLAAPGERAPAAAPRVARQ